MEPKLFVAAKGFIVFNKKVLVLRESKKYEEGTNSGHFDVPGGRLKPGQDIYQSLLREIEEETGFKESELKVMNPFFVNEARPTVKGEAWQIIRIFFMVETSTDRVTLSVDHDKFEWINPAEYKKHSIIENLHPVFEEFLKHK